MSSKKLYLFSWIGGSILNAFLLILICSLLGFNSKSAICVYIYGIPGFFLKGSIAFTPYILLYQNKSTINKCVKVIIAFVPLLLFILWHSAIMIFQIERFYIDLEFGYTSRLPHFIVQVFTTLVICLTIGILITRKKFD